MPPSLDTLQTFFSALFGASPPYVELRTISGMKTARVWEKPENVAEVAFKLILNGYDIRFGVLPHLKGGGKLADIVAYTLLYVDIDEVGEDVALARLGMVAVDPTLIVGSGKNIHAYWVFREAYGLNKRHVWQRLQWALVRSLEADESGTDATRVLRIPGTFNEKRKKEVRLIRCSGEKHSIGFMCEMLNVSDDEKQQKSEVKTSTSGPPQPVGSGAQESAFARLLRALRVRYQWKAQSNIAVLERCPACVIGTGKSELWKSWIDLNGNLRCWRTTCPAGPRDRPGGLSPYEWIPFAIKLKWLDCPNPAALPAFYARLDGC